VQIVIDHALFKLDISGTNALLVGLVQSDFGINRHNLVTNLLLYQQYFHTLQLSEIHFPCIFKDIMVKNREQAILFLEKKPCLNIVNGRCKRALFTMNSPHADTIERAQLVLESGFASTEQYVFHSLKNAVSKQTSDLTTIEMELVRIMLIMYPTVINGCYTDLQYQPIVEIFAACVYYKSYGLDYICSIVNTVYTRKFDIARVRYEILFLIYKVLFGISAYEIMLVVKTPQADDCVFRIAIDLAVDGHSLYEIARRNAVISEDAFTLEFENGELIAEDCEFLICKQFFPQQKIIMRNVRCKEDRVLLRKLKNNDYNNKTATIFKRVTNSNGKNMIWVRMDGTGKLIEVGEKHGVEIPLHLNKVVGQIL